MVFMICPLILFWGCNMMFLSILAYSQSGTLLDVQGIYLFPCKPKGFNVQQLLIAGKTAFHWNFSKTVDCKQHYRIHVSSSGSVSSYLYGCSNDLCSLTQFFRSVRWTMQWFHLQNFVRIWCNVAQEPEFWNQSVLWIFYWRIVHIAILCFRYSSSFSKWNSSNIYHLKIQSSVIHFYTQLSYLSICHWISNSSWDVLPSAASTFCKICSWN